MKEFVQMLKNVENISEPPRRAGETSTSRIDARQIIPTRAAFPSSHFASIVESNSNSLLVESTVHLASTQDLEDSVEKKLNKLYVTVENVDNSTFAAGSFALIFTGKLDGQPVAIKCTRAYGEHLSKQSMK
jgi:hypothetical protein